MKKFFFILVLSFFFTSDVFATNTYSVEFDEGSSEYITNASVNWGSGTSWQATMWVHNTSVSNEYRRFFGNNNGGLASNDIILREDGGGQIGLLVNNGAGNAVSTGVTWKDGWHWFAIISDGSTTKVYIDTNDTAIISVNAVSTPYDGVFMGGYYQPSGNEYFEGLIDDVRIFNDNTLSLDDLQAIRNIEICPDDYSNLVAYWKYNNDYTDETANGYDLTAFNSPAFNASVPFATSDTCGGGGPTSTPETPVIFDTSVDSFINQYKNVLVAIGASLLLIPFIVGIKDVILRLYRFVRTYFA